MTTCIKRAHQSLTSMLCAPPRSPGPILEDPDYRALRAEIDRAQDMTGEETDWARVEELGQALFKRGFDDFLVSAYLARASQARAGLDGIALGLALFAELLGPRSATASPPPRRLRARKSALRWWTGAALDLLRRAPAASSPREEDLEAAFTALQELATATLGADAPSLAAVTREVRRITQPAKAKSEPRSAAPPPTPKRTDATPDISPDTAPEQAPREPLGPIDPKAEAPEFTPTSEDSRPTSETSPSALPRELKRLGSQLIDASQRLREQDLRDPRGYDLLRYGLWLHIDALPPATDGKTAIPPRGASAARSLDALATRRDWPELVHMSERLLVRNRLDLDLQRTCAQALTSLDPPAEQAAQVVLARTRDLLARLPGLLTLCRSDGSPLADADTRAWLRPTIDAPAHRPARSLPAPPTVDAPATPSEAPQGQSASFLERLNVAEAALKRGDLRLAAALFVGLDRAVERHHLDAWRPDLARRVLVGALMSQANEPELPFRPSLWQQRLGALCPSSLAEILGARAS